MMQIINNTGAIIKEQINLSNIDNLNIDDLFKNNTNNKKMKNNNYPTWLVPLEIAIKLKEIGFDEPCIFSYSEGIGITACLRYGSGEEPYISDFIVGGNTPNSPYIDLPTYEQVFEWFREKGFRISSENHEDSTKFMFYNMKINEGKHFKGEFSNYEEAREALVKALIQTYKNEQL